MVSQLTLEILISFAVISSQFCFFFTTIKSLNRLKNFFPIEQLDETIIEEHSWKGEPITLLKEDSVFNYNFKQVIISINKYLCKNRGLTDFTILKSIIERKMDSLENEGTANISLPLYIGLMGTFVGIVLGLVQIAFKGGVTDANISGLIGGVVLAMIGSFFGLLLTVINNSYHLKKAKIVSDGSKNRFYDILQIELLPHLENGLYDALDRLKVNINDFNQRFEVNIELFDTKFSSNISSLKDTVASLSQNMGAVIENTKTQQEFLLELKKIGYNKMAEANLKVFSLLNEALPTLLLFIEKQKELNTSVDRAASVVQTINSIMNRVSTFEKSINDLGENINTNQFLGSEVLKRIDSNLVFLDKQFELLKRHELTSSDQIESHFKKQYRTIEILTENIKQSVEDALTINIKDNPFQKLIILESLDTQLQSINDKIDQREVISKGNAGFVQNALNDIGRKLDLKEAVLKNESEQLKVALSTFSIKLDKVSLNSSTGISKSHLKDSIPRRLGIRGWFSRRFNKV